MAEMSEFPLYCENNAPCRAHNRQKAAAFSGFLYIRRRLIDTI